MATNVKTQNTGLIYVVSYVVLFLVNAIVILLANALFPENVVLGTVHIPVAWAVIHSMGSLALINLLGIPFANWYEKWRGKILSARDWMIYYLVLNFAGLWLITRFSDQLGLGVSSFLVILVLAVVLDVVQGLAMMQLEKFRSRLA